MTTFVDIHVVQTLPYANLNRDDLGIPKSVTYGGSVRARVSSQAWKRAMRTEIELLSSDPASRSKRHIAAVADRLEARGWAPDTAIEGAKHLFESVGLKTGKKDDRLGVLVYLAASQLDDLAGIIDRYRDRYAEAVPAKSPVGTDDIGEAKRVISSVRGSVSLFGRMLAELPAGTVDGALRVAHAISTHPIEIEQDYYTAVDDLNPQEDTGAGHLDVNEFVSATLYRYATVDVDELARNVAGRADVAAELLTHALRTFVQSMPTGKVRSTAPYTLPGLVHVAVRTDRPVSLAPAFEAPVRSRSGFEAPSVAALGDYRAALAAFVPDSSFAGVVSIHPTHPGLGETFPTFQELVDRAVSAAMGSASAQFTAPPAAADGS